MKKILYFEVARAVDDAALGIVFAANDERALNRRLMLLDAGTALPPLLQRIRGTSDGVPWLQPDAKLCRLADTHLHLCGRFANLLRLAAVERYRLAQATFVRSNHLVLDVANGDVEREEMAAVREASTVQ